MDKGKYIAELLIREGGEKYTDRAADRGGPTRWGVTEKTARQFGYKGRMQELPLEVAVSIYALCYWRPQMIDDVSVISESLAICMFDFGVNSGVSRSIRTLQRLLNVLNNGGLYYEDLVEDGLIGAKTLVALKAFSEKRGGEGVDILVRAFNASRIAFCVTLSANDESQEANTYGWLSRVVHLV